MLKPGRSLHSIMADISIRLHCQPFIPRLQLHGFSILISHCSFRFHSSLPPPTPPLLFFAFLLILFPFTVAWHHYLLPCNLATSLQEQRSSYVLAIFFFTCLFVAPCFFLAASSIPPNLLPQAGNLARLLHRLCMNDTNPFSPSSTSFRFES